MSVGELVGQLVSSRVRSLLAGGALSCVMGMGPSGLGGVSQPVVNALPHGGAYTALGDSYTAGPLIPNPIATSGLCQRSDHDYPALVAARILPAAFQDVSCGGASTLHMTEPQLPATTNPQFIALTQDTRLVTLGIGANDIDLVGIAMKCSALGLVDPVGAPCKDFYGLGGSDKNVAAIHGLAPRIGGLLAGIHARSPKARVLLVGYPDIFPEVGAGCWPSVPIAPGDMPYLVSVEESLNRMLARQAAASGATYVDTYTTSIGHDICQQPGTRWLEWFQSGKDAAPIHPNALAMENDARRVLTALGR